LGVGKYIIKNLVFHTPKLYICVEITLIYTALHCIGVTSTIYILSEY